MSDLIELANEELRIFQRVSREKAIELMERIAELEKANVELCKDRDIQDHRIAELRAWQREACDEMSSSQLNAVFVRTEKALISKRRVSDD